MHDDADLKQLWSELIPLYDFEYDPEKSAAAVEAGIYRHEAHNWCFQHNWGAYDLKDAAALGHRAHAGHGGPRATGSPRSAPRRRSRS